MLELVAEGYTTPEIARRLGISDSTVNSHVGSAKRKLGSRTRLEAAIALDLTADGVTFEQVARAPLSR